MGVITKMQAQGDHNLRVLAQTKTTTLKIKANKQGHRPRKMSLENELVLMSRKISRVTLLSI